MVVVLDKNYKIKVNGYKICISFYWYGNEIR